MAKCGAPPGFEMGTSGSQSEQQLPIKTVFVLLAFPLVSPLCTCTSWQASLRLPLRPPPYLKDQELLSCSCEEGERERLRDVKPVTSRHVAQLLAAESGAPNGRLVYNR